MAAILNLPPRKYKEKARASGIMNPTIDDVTHGVLNPQYYLRFDRIV